MAHALETFGAPEAGRLTICQLEPDDREAYSSLLGAVQRAAWQRRYVEELRAATTPAVDSAFSDEVIRARMADMSATEGPTTYLTAEMISAEGIRTVVGFVRTARYGLTAQGRLAYPYVKDINVAPQVSRQGVGSLLLDRVLSHFPPDRRVAIYTHSANTPALVWYQKLGFRFREDDQRPPSSLGTYELTQLHLEASSVEQVRAELAPALERSGYMPAEPDPYVVATNL